MGWLPYLSLLFGLALVTLAIALTVPESRQLCLLFGYSVVSNSMVPMPHDPVLALAAGSNRPELVALIGAIGTAIPCYVDYRAVTFVFRQDAVARVRGSAAYLWLRAYFLRAPWLVVVLSSFLPIIPFYPVRVLAPASGYPLWRYSAGVFVGRFPRFYIVSLVGSSLLPTQVLVVGTLVAVGLYFLQRFVVWALTHRPS